MVIVLGLLVVILGVEILVANNLKVKSGDKGNKEMPVKINDGVKLLVTKKDGNDVVQKYEIVLNGKRREETLVFKSDVNVDEEGRESYNIDAKLDDILLFSMNDYDGYDGYVPFKELAKSLEEYITKRFNEKNFVILKGKDKNYLGGSKLYFWC